MIVIGTDTHKRTHTCGAVFAGTGQLAGELTAPARKAGFAELLDWGRRLDPERIWAIEDCRHVSGSLERFLVDAGERVVRVPPKLMGESRRGERAAGKSDPIDALAVARAALREGPDTLPTAHLDEAALNLKLLLDHREDLVRARSEDQQRLRWHLHDLWPDFELPAGCLDRVTWLVGLLASSPAPSRALASVSAASWSAQSGIAHVAHRSSSVRSAPWSKPKPRSCSTFLAAEPSAQPSCSPRPPAQGALPLTPSLPDRPGSRRSRLPRGAASGTASIAAAIVSSTAPFTASR
jgi:transposase